MQLNGKYKETTTAKTKVYDYQDSVVQNASRSTSPLYLRDLVI